MKSNVCSMLPTTLLAVANTLTHSTSLIELLMASLQKRISNHSRGLFNKESFQFSVSTFVIIIMIISKVF
jgi:hypothetical protein